MQYNDDGTTNPPRRFQTMSHNIKNYKWVLKLNRVGYMPVSMYRDIDNWKSNRPFFNNNLKTNREERDVFLSKDSRTGKPTYRLYQLTPDFVLDIDGHSMYDTWERAKDVLDLYHQFNIMCAIWPSGNKGWQILVPGYKTIPKEYFYDKLKESNTHHVIGYFIKKFLEMPEIDESAFYDLRFIKQPYTLDGRNGNAIMPLTYEQFMDFINLTDT